MTGGPVTKARAEPSARAVSASTIVKLKRELISAVKKVDAKLASMKRMGITPALNHTDPAVKSLLTLLMKNASVLGLQSHVKGSTDLERFRSLNNWLNSTWLSQPGLTGRNQDSPINNSVLTNLRLRLTIALSRPVSKLVSPPIVTGARKVPAPVVPRRVATAPVKKSVLSDAKKSEYGQMVEKLKAIVSHGTRYQRNKAKSHLKRLQKLLAKPTKSGVRRFERRYYRTIKRFNDKYWRRANRIASTKPTIKGVSPTSLKSSVRIVSNLLDVLDALAKDPSKKVTAEEIQRMVPKIWMVGEWKTPTPGKEDGLGPRWQMFSLLKKAADALKNGKPLTALQKASDLLKREQTVAKRTADLAVAIADALLSKNIISNLPSRSELTAAKHLKQSSQRTQKADNSSESIDKEVRDKLETFKKYLSSNAGELSFDYISQFCTYIIGYSATISKLMDLYKLFQRQKSTITNATTRTAFKNAFLGEYAKSALWLVDPDSDVWSRLKPAVQRALRRDIRKAYPGITETQISQLFKSVPGWRYDAAIYQVYGALSGRLAPKISVPAAAEAAIKKRAQLRAARIFFVSEYDVYLTKEWKNVDNRLSDATDFLNRAIAITGKSGLPQDVVKPLADIAKKWLAARKNPATKAEKIKVADAFYHVAVQMTALCQAELVARTPGLRPSAMGANSAALKNAQAIIKQAREQFNRTFGSPNAPLPLLYPSLPSNISDGAINMLSPVALGVTEASTFRSTFVRYENDGMPEYQDALAKQADEGLGDFPPIEQNMWPARKKGRDAALRFASKNEETYCRMLYLLRNNSSFGASPVAAVLRTKAGLPQLMKLLDPRAARSTESELSEFVALRVTLNIADDNNFGKVLMPGKTKPTTYPHERLAVYGIGKAYVELDRQDKLNRDISMHILLRGMLHATATYGEAQLHHLTAEVDKGSDASLKTKMKASLNAQYKDLRTKMRALVKNAGFKETEPLLGQIRTKMYSIALDQSKSYSKQQEQLNRLLLLVLDVRIAELENRLDKGIRLSDGIAISDLERSTDPRAFAVKSAREALNAAKKLRGGFERDIKKDLFASRVNTRQAIMIAENAMAMISDESLLAKIPKSSIKPKTSALIGDYEITAKWNKEIEKRYSSRDFAIQYRARFDAVLNIRNVKTRKAVTVSQYEKSQGPITFLWLVYQTVPLRPGEKERYTFVVSPTYMASPEYKQNRVVKPIGVIVRDATDTKGRKIGDVVVRVRKTAQATTPSKGPVWEPDVDRNGRVNPSNLLYRVVKGTTYAVNDALFRKNVNMVAFRGVGYESGKTVSVLQSSGEEITTKLMLLKSKRR